MSVCKTKKTITISHERFLKDNKRKTFNLFLHGYGEDIRFFIPKVDTLAKDHANLWASSTFLIHGEKAEGDRTDRSNQVFISRNRLELLN